MRRAEKLGGEGSHPTTFNDDDMQRLSEAFGELDDTEELGPLIIMT